MIWPEMSFGEVCHTTSGGTPSRTRPEYFDGPIPWIKSGDLTDGLVDKCEEGITSLGLANSSAKLFPKGTVLMAMYGATVGKLGVLSMEAATNQAICGITPSRQIDRDYLFFYLLSKRRELIEKSTGGAQPNISQKIIRELLIPIPPIVEQRRIVDLLSRAEGIIRLRREAQAKAAEITPALFLDLFGHPTTNPKGWPVVALGEVLRAADYGCSTKASDNSVGLPLIRMGNVTYTGDLDLTDLKYVELELAETNRFRLVRGDLLFNRTNSKELVGKTGLWDGALDAVAASYFIRLRVDEGRARPFYLWAFLNSQHMKRVMFDTARGAIGQANINRKELRAFRLPLPSLDVQVRFEECRRSVLGIVAQQTEALNRAEATFQSLLTGVFDDGMTSARRLAVEAVVA